MLILNESLYMLVTFESEVEVIRNCVIISVILLPFEDVSKNYTKGILSY